MVSNINSTSPTPKNKQANGKKRFKKNALEPVDFVSEFQKDPKFKTELCITFSNTGFCAYGNKCRFAHGKDELFDKVVSHPKYRKSDCITFHTNGFCNYGQRCHFRHNETTKLNEISRSHYSLLLTIYPLKNKIIHQRLPIFQNISNGVGLNFNNKQVGPTGFNSNNQKIIFHNSQFSQPTFKTINHLKRVIDINMNFNINDRSNNSVYSKNSNNCTKSNITSTSRKFSESSTEAVSPPKSNYTSSNRLNNNNNNAKYD